MQETIYQDTEQNLRIVYSDTLPEGTLDLLIPTIWGTTGTLYTEDDLPDVFAQFPPGVYFSLMQGDELAGTYMGIPKRARFRNRTYDVVYAAYLAMRPEFAGQGYGSLIARESAPYLLDLAGEPGIVYAFVDQDNARSLEVLQKAGYRSLVRLDVTALSRYRPKDDPRVSPLQEAERERMVRLLEARYADHALLDFDQSLKVDEYYVLRENSEIVAGIQSKARQFTLVEMPDALSNLMLRLFTSLPQPWFKPGGVVPFNKIGNVYFRPGHAQDAFRLLESVFARKKIYSAIAYFDPASPIYRELRRAGSLGLLGPVMGAKAHAMALYKGMSEEEIAELQSQPIHLSPRDV